MVEEAAASPSNAPPEAYRRRDIAEGFGSDAGRYDRTRPHYPQALADAVLAGLSGRRVLDVGIGTGLSALPFRAAGAEVRGVEVDARMAELARGRGFEVGVARFEDWNAGGATFDAVVAGQTWHWIDPAAGAAKAADVLDTGGRFAAFWNAGDPNPEIATAFGEVYRSVDTGLPFVPWAGGTSAIASYESIFARTADGLRAAGTFTEPARLRFDWQTTVTKESWLDQVPTMGGHNRIAPDRLSELLAGFGAVIDAHGGAFTMSYATIAVTADRR